MTVSQSHYRQVDWNLLRIFYFLCQSSSLSEAGKHLHVSQSSLSRRLINLEDNLGYRVFNRGQKGIHLTEEGKELSKLVSMVFDKITHYQAKTREQSQTVQGVLKVCMALHLPTSWLMHHTTQFLENYPDLHFKLNQQTVPSNHFTQYADCAIQPFDASRQDELIQRPLCKLSYGLYASQRYMTKNSRSLTDIESLDAHPKLLLRVPDFDTPFGWPESVICDSKITCVHEFSNAQDLLEATRQGLGIAALPSQQAALSSDLVPLPLYTKDQVVDLYYAYPKYYQDLKRVTFYGDFLEQALKDDVGLNIHHCDPTHDLPLATEQAGLRYA